MDSHFHSVRARAWNKQSERKLFSVPGSLTVRSTPPAEGIEELTRARRIKRDLYDARICTRIRAHRWSCWDHGEGIEYAAHERIPIE
jgi:hypothetical protein